MQTSAPGSSAAASACCSLRKPRIAGAPPSRCERYGSGAIPIPPPTSSGRGTSSRNPLPSGPKTASSSPGSSAASATVVDLVRRRRCDLVVNTPAGRGARSDGYLIREAALAARVPCTTTLAGAFAAVEAIARARSEDALSLQERVAKRTA